MSNQTPVLTFIFDFDNIVICKKKKTRKKEFYVKLNKSNFSLERPQANATYLHKKTIQIL